MAMAWIWTGMVTVSLVFAAVNGTMDAVSAAALEGAGAAVELCIAMAGVLCLWSGVMELMSRCGLSRKLAAALRPALGNAATPLGIRAARRMARGQNGVADDELCRLVVLNTASLQLLPTTVAGVRAACGCRTPFDILPAVWLSSAISVTAGLLTARLLSRVWRS